MLNTVGVGAIVSSATGVGVTSAVGTGDGVGVTIGVGVAINVAVGSASPLFNALSLPPANCKYTNIAITATISVPRIAIIIGSFLP